MRRGLRLVPLVWTSAGTLLSGCTPDAPPAALARSEDPYAPLAADELRRLVSALKDGLTDRGGTESAPSPALDRPYAHLADAVNAAHEALRAAPDSPGRRLELARLYAQAGREDLARVEYGRLLALRPEDPALHVGYGRALWYERFAGDDALLHLRAARALRPSAEVAIEISFLLGDIAESRDDAKRAEAFFAAVVKRTPGHAEAHYRLGALARARDDPDEAFARFRRALALDPRHVGAHFGLGQLLVKRGATAEGTALLERHSRLRRLEALGFADRDEAFQCIVLGNHDALAGSFDSARAEFERALALEPGNEDARSYHAAVLLDLGRVDEALAEWERVLEGNHGHVHALVALAEFHLGDSEDPRRSREVAFGLVRRAVEVTGRRDVRTLSVFGRALAALGRTEEAGAVAGEVERLRGE